MSEPIFYDCETCGFTGPIILIQWALGSGPIHLHNIWREPVIDTMKLIEWMMYHEGGLVGFNMAFDHFHLQQTYTTLSLLKDPFDEPDINEYAIAEEQGRFVDICLKPVKACDLMLHARKGPYQSTMDRSDIRIKRIPTALAWQLAAELEKRIPLKDIYFARRKNKYDPHFKVYDLEDGFGRTSADFKDIVLKFAPSSALKALATDALNLEQDQMLLFADIEVGENLRPTELGYAPYALAVGTPENWKGAWPDVIHHHISHWQHNTLARKYAEKDIVYTRDLYKFFGSPDLGDTDSTLACLVGAVRWRGYAIDVEGMRKLRAEAITRSNAAPKDPARVKEWIFAVMDETEQAVVDSTKKTVLEEISKWTIACPECCEETFTLDFLGTDEPTAGFGSWDQTQPKAEPNKDCPICKGKGETPHPAAIRAKSVIGARSAAKERELYDKLILAGRFHASFKVIGTLSSRMAGADDLNPQGIKATKEVRANFILADMGFELEGGDFESFEVAIMEAVYKDEKLREQLQTLIPCPKCGASGVASAKACKCKGSEPACKKCAGTGTIPEGTCGECDGSGQIKQKIHGLFAMEIYPGETYEDILESKGTEDDHYHKGKTFVFLFGYGGNESTMENKLAVPAAEGIEILTRLKATYPGIGRAQQRIYDLFCSMRQPAGIGTRVEWHEPADYIESLLGFRRYFTLENRICKALFDLAEDPPKAWEDLKIKVIRRDRTQTAVGALRSALFACAFAIQAANMRAAANHEIQCTGAQMTKILEVRIWEIQPCGVHRWEVIPMNVHDEVMAPSRPEHSERIRRINDQFVEEYKELVPLLGLEWKSNMSSWAEK